MSMQNRIVSQARELFFRYGINSITTDNISLSIGISKRTFYQYFESKQKLVEVIVIDEINVAWRILQALKRCNYTAVLEAIRISELDLKYTKTRNINFLRDIQRAYPDVWKLFEEFRQRYVQDILVGNIDKGKSETDYWPDLDVNLTASLWSEISYVHYRQAGANEAVRQHFIRGMLTARGMQEYQKYCAVLYPGADV